MQSWFICSGRLHSANATGGTEIKHENPHSGNPESRARFQLGTSLRLEPSRDINMCSHSCSISSAGNNKSALLIM